MVDVLADTPLTDRQAQALRSIKIAGGSLLELLNNILDLSHIEAGGLIMKMSSRSSSLPALTSRSAMPRNMHDYLAPAFAPFTEVLGFKDALLVADDGRVLFGFGQGREVGEDVKAGPLAGTSLAAAWRQAMQIFFCRRINDQRQTMDARQQQPFEKRHLDADAEHDADAHHRRVEQPPVVGVDVVQLFHAPPLRRSLAGLCSGTTCWLARPVRLCPDGLGGVSRQQRTDGGPDGR